MHGYGDYVQRYGYFARVLAEAGFDVVGIDQKGFGYSEGLRGFIQSADSVVDDLAQHVNLIDSKYGGEQVKKFIIGFSLGGLLSVKLNALRPNYFSSIALIAPYFNLLHRQKFERFNESLEQMNQEAPT